MDYEERRLVTIDLGDGDVVHVEYEKHSLVTIDLGDGVDLYTDRVSDAVVSTSIYRVQIELFVLNPRTIRETQLQSGYSDDPIGRGYCSSNSTEEDDCKFILYM